MKCRNCQGVIAVPISEVEESDFEFVVPAKPLAAVPAKAKSKPSVIEEDDEEEDSTPRKKAKAKVVEDDYEEDEAPKPKKKSKAAITEDDEDESPKRSQKKSKRVVAEDDEDADEDDDAPKKKKGKKPAKKTINPLVFVGAGVVALFAVACLGTMIWYVVLRDKSGAAGNAAGSKEPPVTVPPGWTKQDNANYTAYFQDSLGSPKAGITELRIEKVEGRKVRLLEINVMPAAEVQAEKNYDTAMSVYVIADGVTSIGQKEASLDGKVGREYKIQDSRLGNKGYCRMAHVNGRLYLMLVQAPDWAEADEMARIFFGSVKFKP